MTIVIVIASLLVILIACWIVAKADRHRPYWPSGCSCERAFVKALYGPVGTKVDCELCGTVWTKTDTQRVEKA